MTQAEVFKKKIEQLRNLRMYLKLLSAQINVDVRGLDDVLNADLGSLKLPTQEELLSLWQKAEVASADLNKVSEEVVWLRFSNDLMDVGDSNVQRH